MIHKYTISQHFLKLTSQYSQTGHGNDNNALKTSNYIYLTIFV